MRGGIFMFMNYFELFEIQPAPSLTDHTYVAKKYQSLQKKFHPDFFTDATEEEKEEVLRKSAAINKGYNILRNKHKLLEYFLQEKGEIKPDEKFDLPPDFLMEMMEINESISEGETTDAEKKVQDFESSLNADVKNIFKKKPSEISAAELKTLKEFFYKTKYLQRVLDRI